MGRELALQLLERGARVAAVDINEEALAETSRLAAQRNSSWAENVAGFGLNISEREAVRGFPDEVVERFGGVDGLINNAGVIQPMVKFSELEFDQIDRVINVNLHGVLNMTKAFLPHLLERSEAHIVNVASMGGFLPVPGQTIYGASKAAVKLFTEGLWSELASTNVRVTVVFPGAINTDIAKNSGLADYQEAMSDPERKAPPMTSADDAARTIIEGMEANSFRVLVGRDARLMDRFYRFSPERATRLIYRQMRSILPE